MANLDLKKTLKHLYSPSKNAVSVVDVPAMNYLMIDGEGNPNTSEHYAQAVQALYTLAYGIRAISRAQGTVFTVMPLEGLWWYKGEQIEKFKLTNTDKDNFLYTMMILQPEHITPEMLEQARKTAHKKKPSPLLDAVRFERYHEGESVQILHIGSYNDEGPNVKRLHDHIKTQGWLLDKKHHEIYLSDPRKVAPEKLKTVIRQPFARA